MDRGGSLTVHEDEREELVAELENSADTEYRLVELIRLDYDATLRAMSGFIGTSSQVRAIGVAVWGVVLGLAVRAESGLLAILALAVIVIFSYGDAYHAALYRRALSRAISLEELLDAYLDRLGIDAENTEAILRTRAKLETHKFGMHRSLRSVTGRDLLAARPRAVFWVIYPALAAVTVGLALGYWLT
jgi:hypothetical protein